MAARRSAISNMQTHLARLVCGHDWSVKGTSPDYGDTVYCRPCCAYQVVTVTEVTLARELGMLYSDLQQVRSSLSANLDRKPTMTDLLKLADNVSEVSATDMPGASRGVDWSQSAYAPHLTETHKDNTWRVFSMSRVLTDDEVKEMRQSVIATARALEIGYKFRTEVKNGKTRVALRGADRKQYVLTEEGKASRNAARKAKAEAKAKAK